MSGSLVRAFVNQRRSVLVAIALCIAAIWICAPLGNWELGVFVAIGVLLSLVNHVLTEQMLVTAVDSGDMPTRNQYASRSLVRLLGVSLVAVVLAVLFWPAGAGVFVGLALFHLIALVFTGIPLLKEIKKV